MTTCKDCYRRNPSTGYCPVRTYEVEEDHEPCGSYATPPRDMNESKEEATKVCKRCGKELPLSSFSRNRNGLLGVCKDCMKAAQKKGAKPAKPEPPKEEPAHPELHDEKIRKEIIDYLSNELHNVKQLTPRTNEFEAWIAYLEKQKAQQPAEWSDEDVRFILKDVVRILRDRGYQIEASIIVTEKL